MSAIGNRIYELRMRLDMTQDQVAREIGTTKQTIYKYENGVVTNIPLDKIEQLSKLFCVSPAYLTGWSDTNNYYAKTYSSDDGVPSMLADFWHSLDDAGKERFSLYISSGLRVHDSDSSGVSSQILSPDENQLVSKYRCLDSADQGRILERIDTILENEKYQKDASLKNA